MSSIAMRGMLVLVLVLGSRVAPAQPTATPEAFEACKARRQTMAADAQTIADLDERSTRLAAMPICRREADGSLAVIQPPPPPPADTSPFAPHLEVAMRAGFAASSVYSGAAAFSGMGPFIELEAGYRFRRMISVAAFGAFTNFHDGAVGDTDGIWNVHESLYDLGARVHLHYRRLFFGGGLGIEEDRSSGFANMDYATVRGLVELHAGYTFARTDRFAAQALFVIADAHGDYRAPCGACSPTGIPMEGLATSDLVSLRLGVGVAF